MVWRRNVIDYFAYCDNGYKKEKCEKEVAELVDEKLYALLKMDAK